MKRLESDYVEIIKYMDGIVIHTEVMQRMIYAKSNGSFCIRYKGKVYPAKQRPGQSYLVFVESKRQRNPVKKLLTRFLK